MDDQKQTTGETLPEAISSISISGDSNEPKTDNFVCDFDCSGYKSSISSEEPKATGTVKRDKRTLPDGKTFHLFFVYRTVSPDKDWVASTVDKLESDYPGFRCGYHVRDFIPGRSIFDNISSCLMQSVKVAFILTPQFLQSEWTKYETELAKCFSLNRGIYGSVSLLPILLEECELPDCLKDTTYLDVQGDAKCWLDKLVTTVTEKDQDVNNPATLQFVLISRFSGGKDENVENLAWLLDVAFDVEDNVIVSDGAKKAVKKFSIKGEILATVTFDTRPDCLTNYENSQFLVTFPHEPILKIIATKHEMEVVQTIPFLRGCCGICRIDENRFAVASYDEQAVLICTNDCEIKKRIRPSVCPGYLELAYLAVSPKGTIFVTDHYRQRLIAVPLQGEEFSVKELQFRTPRKVCFIGEYMLVAADSIRLCTLCGDQIRDCKLPGVFHVLALAYNPAKSLVAITHKSDGEEEISVYRLVP